MENADSTAQSSVSQKSNSKVIQIVIILVVLLLLGIGVYLVMGKMTAQPQQNQAVTQNAPSPTTAGIITSIKDALAQSQSLQCDYTDDTGRQTTSYIKGGAVRVDYTGQNAQESGSMIMKDKKMYFWNGKQGMMMEFDIDQIAANVTPSAKVTPGQQNPDEVMENLEKYKENCRQAAVADSLFVPPADVKFIDTSKMIKTAPKIPTGAMTEEQIQELQKQFQQ